MRRVAATGTMAAVGLLLIVGAMPVSGQAARPGARAGGSRKILRVRPLRTLNPRFLVETPQYNTSESRGKADPQNWRKIELQYETYPEWIDELVVQYYAMGVTRDPKSGKKVFSLYKLSVKYADVAQGRAHKATVFLRPTAVKRYGDLFAVAAVFSVGGQVVDEVSEETQKMPKKWWKDQRVVGRQDVTVRTGYLVNRAKSPWALINIDDYEVIK